MSSPESVSAVPALLPAVIDRGTFSAVVAVSAAAAGADDTTCAAYVRLFDWARRADRAYPRNTRAAWRSDWTAFSRFCSAKGLEPLPASPTTIEQFIEWRTALKKRPSSIDRAIATISRVHRAAEVTNPCDTEIARLAKRTMRQTLEKGQRQSRGITWPEVEKYLALPILCLRDHRDRALAAAAYDVLCRQSELVAFNVEDCAWQPDGSGTVTIRESKTDQVGKGFVEYFSPVTVSLVKTWLSVAEISSGPIFREVIGKKLVGDRLRARAVAERLRRITQWIGLSPEECAATSGHSARVGAAQDLSALGIELPEIMEAGRWKDPRQVVRYIRHQLAGRSAMARAAKAQGRA